MAEKMMPPQIEVKYDEPTDGYWDWGLREKGTFTLQRIEGKYVDYQEPQEHPGTDRILRWGAFELNFWFNSGSGRTWKEAASIAQRRLVNIVSAPATVKIIWPEGESSGHLR